MEDNSKIIQSEELDPWSLFIYAMKAPMTRNRYQTRLAKFFDFIGIAGTRLEDRARAFAERGKNDSNWAFNNIVKFVQFQLFFEMADIPFSWKKIMRGLPKGKKYADDRIPTIEEIQKLVEYPDRRIKAIACTMASSGIRIGAWDYRSVVQ